MKTADPKGKSDTLLERLAIPLCLTYLFLLATVFGPFALWSANRDDLTSGFLDLLPELLAWTPGVLAVGGGFLLLLLPLRPRRIVTCLHFSALVFLLIEFNFFRGESALVGNVGDGIQVDTTGPWIRLLLFAGLIVVTLVARKHIQRIATWVVACLAFAGIAQVAISALTSPAPREPARQEDARSSTPADFFTFSRDENIIHVILDELQYSFFERVVRSELPDYESELDGFVFYRNHLGLYPNTGHSMYSLFRNTVFYNDRPTRDWMDEMATDSIFHDLVSAGVGVSIMSPLGLAPLSGEAGIDHTKIPVPYVDPLLAAGGGTPFGSGLAEAEILRHLAIERLVPDPLLAVWRGPGDGNPVTPSVDSRVAGAADTAGTAGPRRRFNQERALANALVIRDWAAYARVGANGTVYRQLHTIVTHNPPSLNADCTPHGKVVGANWETMYPQTVCALRLFLDFCERLEKIGAYDNSTIIVHADHGKRHARGADAHLEEFALGAVQEPPVYDWAFSRVISSAMPILLVKRRNARHPLRVSNAPTSFSDIAPTILSLAGVPLEDGERTIFDIEEGEDRERRFLFYHYPNREDPYLDRLVEYRVRGLAWEPSSWRQQAVYLGPHSDFSNDRIDMGATEYRHHERDWWLQGVDRKGKKRTVAYTVGPEAEINVAFPDRADRTMSISMKSMVRGQVLDVDLNGHNLGSITLDDGARFAEYEIGLPGEHLVEPASGLNVIAYRPRRLQTEWEPGQQRIPYGASIDWIAFEVD